MVRPPVFALILAAGQSRRFGSDKLLAPLDGRPVLQHVLDWVIRARESGALAGAVAVVPHDHAGRERLVTGSGIECLPNPAPEEGVAGSLRIGLEGLAVRHPDAEAALVIQGDQPRVPFLVLELLLAGWRGGGRPVIRPRYARAPDTPGHPVLLDRSFWHRAREISGDRGFSSLLERYPSLVTSVDVPGANPDINTPSELAVLESRNR